jgi:hypothetical protein
MDFMATALPRIGSRHNFLPLPEQRNRMFAKQVTNLFSTLEDTTSDLPSPDARRVLPIPIGNKVNLDHSDTTVSGNQKQ